jgi:lipopolysaccharide/colanic/teichoic acid biosynthesis glycosyltransferase
MTPPVEIQQTLKRVVDVAVAASVLATGAPLWIALGLAIRAESPGPALFRQKRLGRGGKLFTLLKFRTMRAGAPPRFNADGSMAVTEGDDRLTRLGAVLRGGVDEIPQLINVLRGEMSLVGPRPDLDIHLELYDPEDHGKLSVRPGITGLPAVLGRNEIPWKTRTAIDRLYIAHWSLGLDLRIAIATMGLALAHDRAMPDDVLPGLRELLDEARTSDPTGPGAPFPRHA